MRIETEHSIRLREGIANFESTLRPALARWRLRSDYACVVAHAATMDCAESTARYLATGHRCAHTIDLLRVHVVGIARAVDAAHVADVRARLAIVDLLELLSELEDDLLGEPQPIDNLVVSTPSSVAVTAA